MEQAVPEGAVAEPPKYTVVRVRRSPTGGNARRSRREISWDGHGAGLLVRPLRRRRPSSSVTGSSSACGYASTPSFSWYGRGGQRSRKSCNDGSPSATRTVQFNAKLLPRER